MYVDISFDGNVIFLLLIEIRRGTPGERENSNRGVVYGNSVASSLVFPISNRDVLVFTNVL